MDEWLNIGIEDLFDLLSLTVIWLVIFAMES